MVRLRAHFDGKVLVPEEPVDLPQGRILDVEVHEHVDEVSPKPGTPAALLHAIRTGPRVSPDIIDEWERAIEEAKLPVRYDDVFDSDSDS